MRLEVSHRTTYRYDQPVALSQHRLHMLPRQTPCQSVLRTSLIVEPAPSLRTDRTDVFGNAVTTIEIEKPHDQLVIHAASAVQVAVPAATRDMPSPPWDATADALRGDNAGDPFAVRPFRCFSAFTLAPAELVGYARDSFPPGRPLLEACLDLTERIRGDFIFDPTATDVSTPIATVLRKRRGVCQDFAHLMIAGLRALELPARYVSGYILTLPPPGRAKLQGADASHAWLSVWCPGIGWVDFDPTNGRLAGDDYVTTAWGRDYSDVSPIAGVLVGGGTHTVAVAVDVQGHN